jgi:hypothetical protein
MSNEDVKAMNCPRCDTSIEYRFSTICPNCQTELPSFNPAIECFEPFAPLQTKKRKLSIGHHVGNALVVIITAVTCTVGGAVMMYGLAGILYRTFLSGPVGTHNCSRGMALGMLSILLGAFLGCTGGSIVGFKARRWSPQQLSDNCTSNNL